jgi:acetylglutamate kinase
VVTGAAGGAHVTQGPTGVGAPGPGVQAGWAGAGAAARALVVKLGGRALDAPGSLAQCAAELQQAAGHGPAAHVHGAARRALVVVHGGGAEVTAWCARAGIEARFAGGLRVTDRPTLEIAAAVLAGLANKRLVAALRARGLDAVGLSALDGGIVRVRRHRDAEVLGEVGEVASVDASLLAQLLAAGRTPVLASLGDDGHGALLNLNADDVAAAVAAALPAADLVLLSDTSGLRLAGGRVDSLDPAALARALGHPDVTGGMLPKLRAAQAALAGGVRRVHIAAWQGAGTLAAILDGTAVATTCHAGPIHDTETEESHA